jgi:NADH-quinone oxidoreductase subunit G
LSDTVTLTIDGKEITVPKGTLVIRAAEQLGIEIPRFCDHPLLEPAGACRQCYVEVEGQPKLFTSCTTTVMEGWAVKTQFTSDVAAEAQEALLEFLLINHPLDCPICDRGGECPLQDQTLKYGPGESRFLEAKRIWPKPLPLSPLIALDRERCVLCQRCTRFCDEISGDRFITLHDRGPQQQVAIAAGEDFDSPFSGNTVQICPVGALTSNSYRFVSRPFDLAVQESVCGHCSAGCNVRVDTRADRVVRVLARDNYDVNDAWTCDKGRYAFQAADAEDRVTTPLLREGDAADLTPVPFDDVFAEIVSRAKGNRVAFLTGGRLMDEDYYALSKLARTVFATNDLDFRRHLEGGEAERFAAASPMRVTYKDVERAKAIVIVGLDVEQEIPILHLRIRKAVRRNKTKVFVVGPRATRLSDVAEHILCAPGAEAQTIASLADDSALKTALREADGSALVISGERIAGKAGVVDALSSFADSAGASFTLVYRRAGDQGALRSGAHPALLPGGRRLEDDAERAEVEAAWGQLSDTGAGMDSWAILEAAAAGDIDVLYLIGVDPLVDFPDAALAERALAQVPFVVLQDLRLGSLEEHADAFLPAAALPEKEGHLTDWEGRGQRVRPVRGPLGLSRSDWEIFAGLARAAGGSLGFGSLEELHLEMGALLAPREVKDGATASAPAAATPASAEARSDSLVLFTYPLLVDDGAMSRGAQQLRAAQLLDSFVEVNTADASRLGLQDGARASLRTKAGDATLTVKVTDGVAEGTVFVPFNNPGLAANTLLSGAFTASVSLSAGDAS